MAGAFARRMMGTALPAAGERPLALRSLIAPREPVVERMGDDLNPVFMLRGKELVCSPYSLALSRRWAGTRSYAARFRLDAAM